jgi:hypothetical protein
VFYCFPAADVYEMQLIVRRNRNIIMLYGQRLLICLNIRYRFSFSSLCFVDDLWASFMMWISIETSWITWQSRLCFSHFACNIVIWYNT